jgi:plastocyanin
MIRRAVPLPGGKLTMRTFVLPLAAVAALAAAAIPAFAATRTVSVGDNYFVRDRGVPTVTVRRGDTVRWRWTGDSPHNVVVTKGPARFSSPVKTKGTYAKKVTRKGVYTIVCTIHGAADQSMKLRVR